MTTSPAPPTFPELLALALRADAARPLVTFYDDATGERVELSVTTYANWVAKTAGLLQDELDLDRGGLALLDLPTHWFGPIWLGAAWTVGLAVTADAARVGEADLVVCGPDGLDRYAAHAGDRAVVAASLLPLGAPFRDPLPPGVHDYTGEVLGLPDSFLSLDPPTGDDLAWRDSSGALTQRDLLAAAATDTVIGRRGRLLTDVNPCTPAGLRALLAPLHHAGGAIWVRNPDPERWAPRYGEERATDELRAAPA